MDTWETHHRSAISESGASRSLIGLDLTDFDIAYMGRLYASEESATLSASGSMNYHDDDASDDQLDQEDECVSKNTDFACACVYDVCVHTCVCMYMCVHAHVCVCMYACTCTGILYVCMCAHACSTWYCQLEKGV